MPAPVHGGGTSRRRPGGSGRVVGLTQSHTELVWHVTQPANRAPVTRSACDCDQMSWLLLCVFFFFFFFPIYTYRSLFLLVDQFSELGVFWLLHVTTSHTADPGKSIVWFFYQACRATTLRRCLVGCQSMPLHVRRRSFFFSSSGSSVHKDEFRRHSCGVLLWRE
jgi:hypothetical protein